MKTRQEKTNYYTDQISSVAKGHNVNYPLTIKISGTENSTNSMPLPNELALIIKDWYFLNGDKI